MSSITALHSEVRIPVGGVGRRDVVLPGSLIAPADAEGIVVFAHGAGSSRLSPRNAKVASSLRADGRFATLLFDLLTEDEDVGMTRRFDIDLLTDRLVATIEWLARQPSTESLGIGLFGASTGAAAALRAAARLPLVQAVVSRGGRPDLAGDALASVTAPTLLIVGGHDSEVAELNRQAFELLRTEKDLSIVPGATHLFEEPGALEQVSALARAWFERFLRRPEPGASS
ncbi:MAG TPA: dienelactone hydrolase family protein [Coriobacteriia bacterium]|nr:dienelactone hydrolase family protein [Coriobacteriia bacterium]